MDWLTKGTPLSNSLRLRDKSEKTLEEDLPIPLRQSSSRPRRKNKRRVETRRLLRLPLTLKLQSRQRVRTNRTRVTRRKLLFLPTISRFSKRKTTAIHLKIPNLTWETKRNNLSLTLRNRRAKT
jgi:hypothetical protein